MRIRIVLSGLTSGIFCLIALWFPWYVVHPSTLVSNWIFQDQAAYLPTWISTAAVGFCGLTLFSFGWVAARWNWSGNWRESLLAGAGAGVIAGSIIYDFLGAFHFGLLGQEEILKAFYSEVGEAQGLTLIVDAVTNSATSIYLNFIVVVFASVLVSALGGLASAIDAGDVWGKSPRKPDGWLFRVSAYSLTLTGLGNLIVMIAALSILQESVMNTAIENNLSDINSFPPFLLLTAFMACLVMILPPMFMTCGWIVRSWGRAGSRRILYGVWALLSIYMLWWMLRGFFSFNFSDMAFLFQMGPFPLWYMWGVIILSVVIGFFGGYLPAPSNPVDENYRGSDWLGYALSQGILGGTQIFASVTAYALVASLITIKNIPHLTQTGTVDLLPTDQIVQLFTTMSAVAQGVVIFSAVCAWIFGLLVLLLRKIFSVKPLPLLENNNANEIREMRL